MSLILANWLNREVVLSEPVAAASIDAAFRDGFLFAELLQKLGLEASVSVKSSAPNTVASNYARLEKTLKTHLKLHLTAADAICLIQGRTGAAARLLYQIKSAVASMPAKKRYLKAAAPEDVPLLSYPSSPVGILHSFLCRWTISRELEPSGQPQQCP